MVTHKEKTKGHDKKARKKVKYMQEEKYDLPSKNGVNKMTRKIADYAAVVGLIVILAIAVAVIVTTAQEAFKEMPSWFRLWPV